MVYTLGEYRYLDIKTLKLLITIIDVFNPFYLPFLGTKCVFKHQYFQIFGLKLNICNFHSLEVVGRGSDPQLQVGENLNYMYLFDTTETQ